MAERNTLPSVEMINWEGLYTKQNPEALQPTQLRECKNADFFREYGSLSKLRGTRRVLNAQYSESGSAAPISWGGFYKTQDLSGAIDRQELVAAGTTIRKVNQDGTTTELLTGEPSGLFRTSGSLDRFMFITSQNPFSIGDKGQMSKYDGTRITQWGLDPPGEQETDLETFNDSSIFTEVNSTAEDSTDIAFDGTATKMTKGNSSTSAYIEDLNRPPIAINNIIEDRCRMNVFIPREHFRTLATSGRAISVYFGSGTALGNNYFRYDFQIGRLFEGWNTLIFDFSTFPSGDFGTTVGSPDDQSIASLRFEIITNNSADATVVYWDNLILLDQGGPVPTLAGAGSTFPQGSSAQWDLRVTFIDEVGNESNAGPTSVTADNTTGSTDFAQIDWEDIPVSDNPAVIRRDLYRTLAGGSEFLFLATLNDNVETTYTDTTPDASLGTNTPPLLGDTIFDNSPPPSSGITTLWKRTAFLAGDPLNPNLLYFSRFDLPEAFPLANAIEFDERITGMFNTYLGLVVATETAYWRVIGDNPDYTVDKVIQGFGGVGPRAVGTARETGWVVDRDGLRLYDLRQAIKVSEVIRDRVDGFNKVNLEDTHTAHTKLNNGIYWLTKDGDGVYSDIYFYQYMIDEIRQGWFSQIVPNPTDFNIISMWEVEDPNGSFEMHCGTDAGMVFEMMAPGSLNWLNEAGQSRAITMELQTAYMRLGSGSSQYDAGYEGTTGRVSPRFIELRVKENTGKAHNWTVTVETSDSAAENVTARDSQALTFAFPAGVSLLRLPTTDLTPAEYVRLNIKNEEKDVDVSIMGCKIYYHVRPSNFAVTSTAGGQN